MKEYVLPTTMVQDTASKFFSVFFFFFFSCILFFLSRKLGKIWLYYPILSTSVKCYWFTNFSDVIFEKMRILMSDKWLIRTYCLTLILLSYPS